MTAAWAVRAISVVLWVLVASGPVLGAVALLRPSPAPVSRDHTAAPAAVTGLAELTVAAHVGASRDVVDPWLEPALVGFRPAPDSAGDVTTAAREADLAARRARPTHVATVGTSSAGPGRWGVTVGVVIDGLVDTYQVSVATSPDGPLVESRPARVTPPRPDRVPLPAVSALDQPDQDAPTQAVTGFLEAYLTGDAPLDRYLAAGADITSLTRPVRSVELLRLASGPYGDGQAVALAEVRTIRADGLISVQHFPLLLDRTNDRWEVRRILPALPLQQTPATRQ